SIEEPGVVRHWNSSGQELSWHSPSDLEDLWCISNDARVLASASNDLSVWDASSGNLLTALPQAVWVTALAFAPDPAFLATGHDDGIVRYWDASTHQLVHEFRQHKRPISALAISGDGKRLAAASEDKSITLWDLESGKSVGTLLGHTDRIPALIWHPDGRHLISAGWDTTARIWDTQTLQPVILLNSHAAQVTALALSPGGELLACADSDNAVHIWKFAERKTLHVLKGTAHDIRCLAFSPDGQRLALGGGDRVIHLWDPRQGQPLSSQGAGSRALSRLALSPDGQFLASNAGGAGLKVWNTATREIMVQAEGADKVHTVVWSPDGKWLAGGTDAHVLLWEAATGKQRFRLEGPEEPITVVAFSADSTLLASASSAGLPAWIWRVQDGEPILLIPDPLDGCTVEALAFHPQRRVLAVGGIDWLATGGSDGAISLWDIDQRCETATFFGGTTALAFDPSGQRVVSTSLDSSLNLWDVESQELIAELMGHEGAVLCVAFSPDGRLIASGGDDRTVRLWDADTGDELVARELDTQVQALCFSPDGQALFTANANTTCYRLEVRRLLPK
ncbi:MAG TPA: WD40 repeat domain-containing protein, partial [Gemmataceae bacterium]|nr:WD40 repeat domain-containing protein [Gemmataceae bacterium]